MDRVVVREAKHYGARISTYRIEYWDGSTWVPTATRSYPSVVQTERFAPVTTTRIRLNITGSGSEPTVQGFEAYRDGRGGRPTVAPGHDLAPASLDGAPVADAGNR